MPSVTYLQKDDIQALVLREVQAEYQPQQLEIEGIVQKPDIASVIAKTTKLEISQTIDIPRISVVPKGEVKSGFKPFQINFGNVKFLPPEETLWMQYLRTGQSIELSVGEGGIEEERPENYLVAALIDYNDVSYDENADLLYAVIIAHDIAISRRGWGGKAERQQYEEVTHKVSVRYVGTRINSIKRRRLK